jgi:gluconolactonase
MAEGLAFPEGPVALPDGGVVLSEIAARRVTHVLPDGRTRVLAEPGGGPNGLAVAPDGALVCCNGGGTRFRRHGDGTLEPWGASEDYSGGRIERIHPRSGRVERLHDACEGRALSSPNDLVVDAAGGIWFTDLGKVRGRLRELGGVFHLPADGGAPREAVFPMEAPNGIGLSPDGTRLVVAETVTARLWAFDILDGTAQVADSRWAKGTLLCGLGAPLAGFDSLAVEADGTVAVATLVRGGITRVRPGGTTEHVELPDRYTTNLCFGGPDRRTAFVCLSSRGLLLRVAWDAPGLAPHFADRIAI